MAGFSVGIPFLLQIIIMKVMKLILLDIHVEKKEISNSSNWENLTSEVRLNLVRPNAVSIRNFWDLFQIDLIV